MQKTYFSPCTINSKVSISIKTFNYKPNKYIPVHPMQFGLSPRNSLTSLSLGYDKVSGTTKKKIININLISAIVDGVFTHKIIAMLNNFGVEKFYN